MEAEEDSVSVCPHLTSSLSEIGNLTSMKKNTMMLKKIINIHTKKGRLVEIRTVIAEMKKNSARKC